MTTMDLTPAERLEVARFGIHAPEVLADLAAGMPQIAPSLTLGPIRAPLPVLEDIYEIPAPQNGAQPFTRYGAVFDTEEES